MGEIIAETNIPRESGWLYYLATNKETGNLTICKAQMARGGKSSKKKKGGKE